MEVNERGRGGRTRWYRSLALWILWSLIVAPAWGQDATVGIKIGGRFNRMLDGPEPSPEVPPKGFIIGPAAEFPLGGVFSVEAAVLYRPRSYSDFSVRFGRLSSPTVERDFTLEGRAWEVPISLRANMDRGDPFSVFAGAGAAFRHTSVNSREVLRRIPNGAFPEPGTTVISNSSGDFGTGLLIGLGGRIPVGRVHFVPEVRFTRWFDPHPTFDRVEKHVAADVLIGISFAP